MISNEKKTVSFRKILVSLTAAVGLVAIAAPAMAAGGAKHPREGNFSFEGPFGTYDQGQLQRGYKVYKEVCASCHGMDLMHFRNLGDKHGPFWNPKYPNPNDNPVVKALAKEAQVPDIDSETGEALMRDATTADKFPNPYPNATAAAAANGGAMPPDLSVMAKARHDGANYIYSLLSGYVTPPAGLKMTSAQHYNPYMAGDLTPFWEGEGHVPPGGFIAMPGKLIKVKLHQPLTLPNSTKVSLICENIYRILSNNGTLRRTWHANHCRTSSWTSSSCCSTTTFQRQ